jgi:membrane-bound lytic murein transglycosylase A
VAFNQFRNHARVFALALFTLSFSACASIIPDDGSARPAGPSSAQPPSAPAGAQGETAARPTPATPGTPLPAPPAPADASTARTAGVQPGRDIASLGLTPEGAARALAAFRTSCSSVQRRADTSGLTETADWQAPCAAARGWTDSDAIRFFTTYFRTVQVGDGRGLATGYYEPEILGSRTRRAGYEVPVYGLPSDLVEADLSQWNPDLAGRRIRGRVDGNRFVPYHDRAAIDSGALANRNLEIAWAADPVELFFLQIQGSGRLRLPDGSVMRIGYAGQNGRDYVGIGRLLRDRGVLQQGEASMQGLMAYLRRQPDGGASIMRENGSWVFFRELTGAGPLGALGLPVVARASVAADPAYIPLGAPVVLAMDRAEANGLWIAQDTGGAIRGANRVDTFWGAGDDARAIAGGMAARGAVLLLLPIASVERLSNR